MLLNQEGRLRHKYIGSSAHLLRSLAMSKAGFSPLIFDHRTNGDKTIQLLFALNNA